MEGKSSHVASLDTYITSSADYTCVLLAVRTFTASDRGVYA